MKMTVQRIAEIRDLNNFEERKVLFSVIDDLCDAWEQQQAEIEQQTVKIKQLEQAILMQDQQIMSKDRLLDVYRGRENG